MDKKKNVGCANLSRLLMKKFVWILILLLPQAVAYAEIGKLAEPDKKLPPHLEKLEAELRIRLNEPKQKMPPGWTIDPTLPIHQKAKLHSEISDPVLGDQAHIVEWAWSPQYAERFGLQPQPDGLPNGGLWLVGVKIERQQYKQWQRYTCNIIGLMDNKLPIITPPGEMYVIHPSNTGMPGNAQINSADMRNEVQQSGIKDFNPGVQTWYKKPANKRQERHPIDSDGFAKYITFYREYQLGLASFEIDVGCASIGYSDTYSTGALVRTPDLVRTEIRFPTRIDGKDDDDPKIGAVFEQSAIKFDLPDGLIRRIYPYTVDADDWTSCLMRRVGQVGRTLTLAASKTKRFGNACEPVTKQPK